MIRRIGYNDNVTEGDIIEFGGRSEPLYLFTCGELEKITPQEYSYLVSKAISKKEFGSRLRQFRMFNMLNN